jgi:hypothetical protein
MHAAILTTEPQFRASEKKIGQARISNGASAEPERIGSARESRLTLFVRIGRQSLTTAFAYNHHALDI